MGVDDGHLDERTGHILYYKKDRIMVWQPANSQGRRDQARIAAGIDGGSIMAAD
jgi:hypothetical protein